MKRVAILIAVIAVLALALLGQEEQRYTSDSVARLSFIGGKTYVQRASDLGYEEAVINTPVTEGDRLGTSEGRAEVHLSRGNYLRLDENSKIDILNLPKKGDDIVRLRVWSGSVYVDIGNLVREKAVEIHTADSSFYVLEPGLYRVDVTENQGTMIYVFNGLLEAAGEQGSAVVKSEQVLEVMEGRFSGEPERFQATADSAFDRWNETRNSDLNQKVARRYLPQELEEYEGELSRYGNWVNMPPYGYVWTPGGVGPDWRPYYDGRWVWLGLTGWTWLPYEPWGWSTFHYGRWHWGVGVGWYWIPTSMWGPAWVNWWWDDSYFGWAPLGWYGYPIAIVDGHFYDRWDRGHYPWNSRAMTVVRRDSLRDPKIAGRALRGDDLKQLSQIELSKRSLDVRPVGNRVTVQPLDGKRVILREGGVSLGRFREGASRAGRGDEGREESGTVTKSKGREGGETAGKADKASPQSLGKGKSGDSGSAPARKSGSSGSQGSSKGRIKKKDGGTSPAMSLAAGDVEASRFAGTSEESFEAAPRSVRGYPSSPSITRGRFSPSLGRSDVSPSRSYLDRYRSYYSGRGSSSRGSWSSPSRTSGSSGSSRSGSISRGSSSGASRGSSSPSHSSSGSHSSGSMGGSVRKK